MARKAPIITHNYHSPDPTVEITPMPHRSSTRHFRSFLSSPRCHRRVSRFVARHRRPSGASFRLSCVQRPQAVVHRKGARHRAKLAGQGALRAVRACYLRQDSNGLLTGFKGTASPVRRFHIMQLVRFMSCL